MLTALHQGREAPAPKQDALNVDAAGVAGHALRELELAFLVACSSTCAGLSGAAFDSLRMAGTGGLVRLKRGWAASGQLAGRQAQRALARRLWM